MIEKIRSLDLNTARGERGARSENLKIFFIFLIVGHKVKDSLKLNKVDSNVHVSRCIMGLQRLVIFNKWSKKSILNLKLDTLFILKKDLSHWTNKTG